MSKIFIIDNSVNVDDTYIRLTLGPVSLDIVLCNYIIDYKEVFKINFLRILEPEFTCKTQEYLEKEK